MHVQCSQDTCTYDVNARTVNVRSIEDVLNHKIEERRASSPGA